MTEAPLNLRRVQRTFRNAFRSEGARLFGWPFIRDYLALAWDSSRRWGAAGPGTLEIAGCRIGYFNRSDALFLLHEIFVNGTYSFATPNPAPRILDCGANIGMATLFFKALYPAASITAVEPAPETFERLQLNVASNHFRDVTLINAALAEREGSMVMHDHHCEPGSLIATTMGSAIGATRSVPAITLSSLLERSADFVKLDIEGAEYAVMREVVASGRTRQVRQLVLEFHDADTRAEELGSMIAALGAAGMQVDRHDDPGGRTGTLRARSTVSAETDSDRAGRRG
jgi:FkbM family methyltransferase